MSAGRRRRASVPRCVNCHPVACCRITHLPRLQLLEVSEGDEAGIKSAMWEFTGRYAYGYLLSEKGTHRLVRLSPFNAKAARQTSFAGVELMPVLTEGVNAEVPEEDLEISFTRSGGKGGQNVNKVETAVRIKHIPTGVFVKCTQERCGSQLLGLVAVGLN
jgi:peptide chain release factor 2